MPFDHQRLRELRRAAGLTQRVVAEAVGVRGRRAVAAWEQGVKTPGLGNVERLAAVLGVPIEALLDGKVEVRNVS